MIKQLLKNIIFFWLDCFFPGLGGRAVILMYHSVGDSGAFFSVKENNFRWQLAYLKRKKYKIIKLSELIKKIKSQEDVSNTVCLTFDDGFRDNYGIVLPLLKQYVFPATIFVATDFVGGQIKNSEGITLPCLSREQIREMAQSGLVEFMPHTQSHCLLDEVSLAEGCREIDQSRDFLEKLTGAKADIFCYPKGHYNPEIDQYLKKNDWRGAVLVKEGLVGKDSDLFRLKRNSIDSTTSAWQFRAKTSEAIDVYNKFKK